MTEHIKVEEHAVGFILRLYGQFIGGDETDALREEFKRLTQTEATTIPRPVIADMTGVTYLNSTALGVFISAHSNFSKRGGKIAICGMNKSIENIFVITKLTLVFEVFPSVDEAIHHFSS
jgi:anti-anti-sigma factor